MKHITIKDIAKELQLSVSTVSRALIDDKNIRRETKEKVLETAQRMGYKRNPVATNLKYGHTNTVGVIVPEMVTPFATKVISGIQEVLYAHHIKVIIADSGESPAKELESIQMMENFMVDGIIVSICSYKENQEAYQRLMEHGMPIVFYDRIPQGWDVPQVLVDDYLKSFFLVEKLIRLGRKSIIHLAGPDSIYNAYERARGYKEAMLKFGLEENIRMVKSEGMGLEDGARIANQLVAEEKQPDAIFAFTDTLAIGAMNRLRELGKQIPEDIAIASFSGTELSTIVHPQLTTVEPKLQDMGRKSAELILELIQDPNAPKRSIIMDAEIQMRASTEKNAPISQ